MVLAPASFHRQTVPPSIRLERIGPHANRCLWFSFPEPGAVGHLSFTEILDTSLKVSWQEPLEKNGIITGKGLCGQKEAKQVCPAQRDGHSSRRHGWQSPGAQGLQGDCRGAKVGGGPVPGASPHVGPSGLGCSLPVCRLGLMGLLNKPVTSLPGRPALQVCPLTAVSVP